MADQTRPPSTTTTAYDAIVVGAGHGGLISGAILARNGLKVLVVDKMDQVGGRNGATNYHGYWLDGTLRDARDLGDTYLLITEHGRYAFKAAAAAGAETHWVGPLEPIMRAHLAPEGGKVISLAKDGAGLVEFYKEIFGLAPAQIAQFNAKLGALAQEDYRKLLPVTFKEYLPTLGDAALQHALLSLSVAHFAVPPEESSVGRLVQYLKNPTQVYLANDPEVGGMQGFAAPFVRVIERHGGEIRTGLETVEILTEGGKATGIVTRDRSCTVQIFEAPTVVFAQPIWTLFDVLDEKLLPADLVARARKLEGFGGDLLLMCLGLSRLPTIRATGVQDNSPTFNRVMRGPKRSYGGGWWIPSAVAKSQTPPGRHLIELAFGTAGPGCEGHEPFKSFAEAKAKMEPTYEYMRKYYSDLDEITEWKTYNLIKRPTVCEVWKTVERAPVQAPNIEGLYFVECTTEVDGQEQDIAANAALQATEIIIDGFRRTRA
jgi:phytoene dehydrogenase-like protein